MREEWLGHTAPCSQVRRRTARNARAVERAGHACCPGRQRYTTRHAMCPSSASDGTRPGLPLLRVRRLNLARARQRAGARPADVPAAADLHLLRRLVGRHVLADQHRRLHLQGCGGGRRGAVRQPGAACARPCGAGLARPHQHAARPPRLTGTPLHARHDAAVPRWAVRGRVCVPVAVAACGAGAPVTWYVRAACCAWGRQPADRR